MAGDIQPEEILNRLEKGRLGPLYLFFGPNEFYLERVHRRIREAFLPESIRDFNLGLFYGDESDPGNIIDAARSFPFMSERRLIIVRRTEAFSAGDLERFLPYLEEPADTTCLIFISSQTDFKKKFYRRIRHAGRAVYFREPADNHVIPWIRRMAKDLGVNLDAQGAACLKQFVGNRLRDLYTELEKLLVRYGSSPVGVEQVEALAIHSRIFTIFELMDQVALRNRAQTVSVLNRFLEEEGRDGVLRILGMLARQIRLLWQTKSIVHAGGGTAEVGKKLGVPPFLARKLDQQSKHWGTEDLECAFQRMYETDALLKTGAQGPLVLENLLLSLCG
jgi:DNA polymerase-3 subunit delta